MTTESADQSKAETTESREQFADRVGIAHDDLHLLDLALSHRSWCAEHPGTPSNERLEFLGDAVLGVIVTDHIYRDYPGLPEGALAKIRAGVVSTTALAEVATELRIGPHLMLGKGEDRDGGRQKRSILADAVEALIGAVYLSGGISASESLVMGFVAHRIAQAAAGPGLDDYKTRLQELAAQQLEYLPIYEIEDHGPEHAKRFTARVTIAGVEHGVGEGSSKKQAEQVAAELAWKKLSVDGGLRPVGLEELAHEPGAGESSDSTLHPTD